jgi:lipopolysaccharide transport system permease protein
MLSVYTFVFSEIFKARWSTNPSSKSDFAILLFAGMIVYGVFSDCINKAPSLVLSQPNYVKKVIFPLEIMPWVSLGAALFHALISTIVLLAFNFIVTANVHATALYLPLVLFPLALFILGVSWLLSSLGIYLRDVGQTVGLATMALMFLSPVFYPVSALPEEYKTIIIMNPLTLIIEETRKILILGESPDFSAIGIYSLASLFICWLGFAWFQKTRRGFSDVM